MIKLIVTDMDGTLLNDEEELNKEFLEVFNSLKEKNILFAVASGRQKRNLELRFHKIKEDLIMLFENGSCGFLNNSELYKSELDKILVHKLIDIGRKNSHNMLLCTEDMAYIENVNEEFIVELRKYYENITFVNDLKAIENSIVKFTVFEPIGAKENSFKIYNGLLGNKIKTTISGSNWLHITNKIASKGLGVQAIQEKFNIAPEETMVFGNSINDLDMFKIANHSYAMENACDEAKELAKFIAPSNNDNGVLETIKKEVLAPKDKLKTTNVPESKLKSTEIVLDEVALEAKLQSIIESSTIEPIVEVSKASTEDTIEKEKPKKQKTKSVKKKEETKKVSAKKIIEEDTLLVEEDTKDDFEKDFPEDFTEDFVENFDNDDLDNDDLDNELKTSDEESSKDSAIEELDEESLEEKLLAILG